jgi:hypothetical protein
MTPKLAQFPAVCGKARGVWSVRETESTVSAADVWPISLSGIDALAEFGRMRIGLRAAACRMTEAASDKAEPRRATARGPHRHHADRASQPAAQLVRSAIRACFKLETLELGLRGQRFHLAPRAAPDVEHIGNVDRSIIKREQRALPWKADRGGRELFAGG